MQVAKSIFERKDNFTGYIEEYECFDLIIEVCNEIKVGSYRPNEYDIKGWLLMMNRKHSDKVAWEEFKEMMMKVMRNAGWKT